MNKERLFFALRPDAPGAARIHQFTMELRAALGLAGRALAVERLHLTLCFLGDYTPASPELVAAAQRAARGLHQAPFELRFDQAMSFARPGQAPLVLCQKEPCAPLMQLHADLRDALAASGHFELETREFQPHVTLLYDVQQVPPRDIAPIAWQVSEFLLVRSLIGQGRHEVVGRYRLG